MNDPKNTARPATTKGLTRATTRLLKLTAATNFVRLQKLPDEVDPPARPKSPFAEGRARVAGLRNRVEMLEKDNRRLETALAELSRKEAASSYLAYHDGLTALPNRRLLMDRFQQAVANADRHQKQVALLFLDLNRFKRINDLFGHSAGDTILQAVAGRIQLMIRATDTACRYGGDEFVVMLPDLEDADVATDIAEKIQDRLAYPYQVDDASIFLQSSSGISLYPSDGIVWETLLQHADASMYRSKPGLCNT